jgi:CO/xanthine dehydrogenase Mo-binding subunit
MGVEGIGASVVRKEDRRFITGKGRYVDDIKLAGMTHAHFVRSPHPHAKVKSIDASEALKKPGVVAVLTGRQLVDDKVGNLICGWMIHSKDGSPMKMGAWPAMAPETVRFVGQAVAVVIGESRNQARDGAEAVVVDYEELSTVVDVRAATVGSLGAGVGLWESAEVRVNPVGTIEILTCSHSHGQGHETTFAQVVADRLGIPISQVSIVHGDTDKVQFGMGTYGSRSGAVGLSAIVKAMEKVAACDRAIRLTRARPCFAERSGSAASVSSPNCEDSQVLVIFALHSD